MLFVLMPYFSVSLCYSVLGVSIMLDVDLSVPFVSADSIFAQASVYFVACAVVVCRHLAAVSQTVGGCEGEGSRAISLSESEMYCGRGGVNYFISWLEPACTFHVLINW